VISKSLFKASASTTLALLSGLAVAESQADTNALKFLETHCLECHDDAVSKGDVRLDTLTADLAKAESAHAWMRVLEQVQADLMPPVKEPRPETDDRRALVRWIETNLAESGHGEAYFGKLKRPEYGNGVDHETLFSGEIQTPPFSPSRLWRVSPAIYDANHRFIEANPYVFPTKESGLRDYAAISGVDQSTIESILVERSRMVEKGIFQARGGERKGIDRETREQKIVIIKPNLRHPYAPFVGDEEPKEKQIDGLIAREYEELFHRAPTDDEQKRYHEFFLQNMAVAGPLEAMKTTIFAIHLKPEAIFRKEIGLGPHDEHGRRRLSAEETFYAIGYALDHRNPLKEPILIEALESGKLKTREGVRETVRALFARPDKIDGDGSADLVYEWSNPRLLQFFREYFGYAGAPDVFKDIQRRKEELGQRSPSTRLERYIVRDLDNLIHWVVQRDRDVLKTLLTTDCFLIGHPGDNELMKERHGEFIDQVKAGEYRGRGSKEIIEDAKEALERGVVPYESHSKQFSQVQLYDLPLGEWNKQEWSFAVEQPVKLDNRKGVLTHPAWLWAQSTSFDTDPIHRGIWIYTRLLAGILPDVPPDVDARVPENPHKTLRERLDVIRAEECWKCHRKVNPLGETFEIFDDWGRYRETFYFDESDKLVMNRDNEFDKALERDQLTTRPIDATGELFESGNPELDGEVEDAFELIDRLAESEKVRQSFVRHVFRFFLGRNETLADSQTLIEADRAYVESGGSFNELVVSILSSDSFLYRK